MLSVIHRHKLLSLSAPGCCMWAIALTARGGILTCPSVTAWDAQWHHGLFACLTVIRREVLRVKPAVRNRAQRSVTRQKGLTRNWWQQETYSSPTRQYVCLVAFWLSIAANIFTLGQLFFIKLMVSWSWRDLTLRSRTLLLARFRHKDLQLAGGRCTHRTALPAPNAVNGERFKQRSDDLWTRLHVWPTCGNLTEAVFALCLHVCSTCCSHISANIYAEHKTLLISLPCLLSCSLSPPTLTLTFIHPNREWQAGGDEASGEADGEQLNKWAFREVTGKESKKKAHVDEREVMDDLSCYRNQKPTPQNPLRANAHAAIVQGGPSG